MQFKEYVIYLVEGKITKLGDLCLYFNSSQFNCVIEAIPKLGSGRCVEHKHIPHTQKKKNSDYKYFYYLHFMRLF